MAAPRLTDPTSVRLAKQDLRRRMKALRPDHTRMNDSLLAALRRGVAWLAGETIAGVWPLAGEADLAALWRHLHQSGHTILMPETPPPGAPLSFRPWHPGCAMRPGRFGTQHPDTPVATSPPDLLFVPLLAFDRALYRLGYGGGYYDRTLAALPRARAIGYGFSVQQVEAVPRGPFDRPLDAIVTERGRVLDEG